MLLLAVGFYVITSIIRYHDVIVSSRILCYC